MAVTNENPKTIVADEQIVELYWARHEKAIQLTDDNYEITFKFENGKNKTYEYVVYPATKCNNPFEDYHNIFKQTEAQ